MRIQIVVSKLQHTSNVVSAHGILWLQVVRVRLHCWQPAGSEDVPAEEQARRQQRMHRAWGGMARIAAGLLARRARRYGSGVPQLCLVALQGSLGTTAQVARHRSTAKLLMHAAKVGRVSVCRLIGCSKLWLASVWVPWVCCPPYLAWWRSRCSMFRFCLLLPSFHACTASIYVSTQLHAHHCLSTAVCIHRLVHMHA